MIRAASKNHDGVMVVVDPDDYDSALDALEGNEVTLEMRRSLAAKAYAHTALYDTAISNYLSQALGEQALRPTFIYAGRKSETLRYGENPHQSATFYRDLAALRWFTGECGTAAGQGVVVQQHCRYRCRL